MKAARHLHSLVACAALTWFCHNASAQEDTYLAPPGTPDYIVNAIEDLERAEAQRNRDANRKPAEILALSEVKPGDRVVEFAGFGQYYTGLLSHIIGHGGEIHVYDLPYTEARSGEASRAFTQSHPNTHYTLVDYNDIALPDAVDVVFNILYYHDLSLNDIDVHVLNSKIFNALKPGGVFLIVDHNARPGSGMQDTRDLHRIDPEVIKEEVTAAGFVLEEESSLLRYPEDDHSQMVFSQGLRGYTDRSVLKFRKPH